MIASRMMVRNLPNEFGRSHFGIIRAGDVFQDSGSGCPARNMPNQHHKTKIHLIGNCLITSATSLSPPAPLP
eukprot:7719802-Karenia_brevis.AAC.1